MRKKMTAIVLAVLVFSLIAASAASLGGISTANVGADVTAVTSCDTNGGVSASFGTTYNSTNNEYDVTSVTINDIDEACEGQSISVTVSGGGAEVNLGPATVLNNGTGADDNSHTFGSFSISAEDLDNIAVVISA